jgi:hypothetical protein
VKPAAASEKPLVRVSGQALVIGVLALALCVFGALSGSSQFFQSYLIAYELCLGVALGSMAILMLYHLVGGMWGYAIRRPLEAASRTLPLLAVFFVPLLFGLSDLYPWARPGAMSDELLRQKAAYLNVPFFIVRAAIYFAVWIFLSWRLNRLSQEQDHTDDEAVALKLQKMSGPGLIAYGLTVTFAGWDWMMSLDPKWWSSIYGMGIMVGQGLSALAVMVLVARRLADEEVYREVAGKRVFHDLGNLLLMLVILWAYMAFSQFLIIWAGNLADEIVWYVPRYKTSWEWIALSLVIFYFFAPFLLLLSRQAKRSRTMLARIAGVILVMRLADLIWSIEPSFKPKGLSIHWMDIVLPVGLGGIWFAAFAAQMKKMPVLALHDARVEGAVQHG